MSSSKQFAMLVALAMVAVAVAPIADSSDADSTDIIDGISINTDGMDSEAFGNLTSSLIEVLNIIRAEPHNLEFTDDPDANKEEVKDMLESAAAALGISITEEKMNEITNSLGTVPMDLLSSSKFSAADDVTIEEGMIATAAEFPEYLIKMFTGDDSTPVEVDKVAEMGILMKLGTEMNVKADEDVSNIGLFTTGFISSINESLGKFSNVAENLLVCDNIDLLKGRDVTIPAGSEYAINTTTNLSVYMSFDADSNVGSTGGDSKFVDYKIGLHIKGGVDVDMERISGSGPQSIKTGVNFNSMDVDFSLGFDNVGTGEAPKLMVGVNGFKVNIDYNSNVDGDLQKCTVKDSGVMNVINGIKISMNSTSSEGFKDVPITSFRDNSGDERDPEMQAVITEAKADSVTERTFDPTMQYMAGGALALIGIILIVAVAAGKKY